MDQRNKSVEPCMPWTNVQVQVAYTEESAPFYVVVQPRGGSEASRVLVFLRRGHESEDAERLRPALRTLNLEVDKLQALRA